jgi:hypothetical protein
VDSKGQAEMNRLKVAAEMSGPVGDTLFVEDGQGDYAVLIPHGGKPAICLVDWSRACRHVEAAKAKLAQCASFRAAREKQGGQSDPEIQWTRCGTR